MFGLLGVVLTGGPGAAAWPYAILGASVHIPYLASLATAYARGDFSLAYPLARGGGAALAAVGGVLLLDDDLPVLGLVAVGVVAAGMGGLAVGARADHLRLALFVAATIGVYTVSDSRGVRGSDALGYASASFLCSGLSVSSYALLRGKGPELLASVSWAWRRYLLTGAVTVLTYTLVLAAVRRAPVGYVAALRESSVVIATVVGWRYLAEERGRQRLAAATVVLGGLVLLVAAR